MQKNSCGVTPLGLGVFVRLWRSYGALPLVAWLVVAWPGQQAVGGTLVSLNFTNSQSTYGTVQIDLFDDLTPLTVANFKQYINANKYPNTIIHRADTGLGVIQGGGYDTNGDPITAFAPVINEYSRANSRGTIAMARTSDPNSAASEWFINTNNNSTTLGPANDGVGYAVFGWVVGGGMSVVDKIQTTPENGGFGSPFGQLPLVNYTPGQPLGTENLIVLESVQIVKTHASYQNPVSVFDVNNDNAVSTLDALVVINDLISKGSHAASAPYSGTDYLDVNGDGQIAPLDALQVINHFLPGGTPLNGLAAGGSALASPQLSSFSLLAVPEPSSWVLMVSAAGAWGGYLLRRRARCAAKLSISQ